MKTKPISVRLTPQLIKFLDTKISKGVWKSRSEAVESGLEAVFREYL